MTDFATAQAELAAARGADESARHAAWQAAETRRALEAGQARLAARFDPDDPAASEERAHLEREIERATGEVQRAREAAKRAREAADAALERFAEFSDPRKRLGELSDRSPLALLPVRIETRFANVGTDAVPRHQLWVRVYPDDCWIDTFEPTLSATEVANAKLYWQRLWSAGGDEGAQRAAWRDLVAAHGSGRAGYVVDHYQPLNLTEQPGAGGGTDEILVIPTQTPLAPPDAGPLAKYWERVWVLGDDAQGVRAARADLEAAVGTARADELVADYVPFNLADAPAPPTAKRDVEVSVAFVVFPADPPPKQASWSQAPEARHLPERFVVLGYSDGAQALEAIGAPVATPLYVGPDPSADPSDSIHPEGEDLAIPDELLWLSDFDRAVEKGMALRIDLDPQQARRGFDRLLVVGVALGATDDQGAAALGELLEHHHTGRSGLTIVPQGTPTHNTSGKGAGYTRLDDADQSFDDRRARPLFTPAEDPLERRDGQWVADALGLDPGLLTGVHAADGTDQIRSRAMHRALWPATLGYWMDKMLTPVFGDETVAETRDFLVHHVSGRGPVPALRIGGQPYGILPTTAFSRIGWFHPDRELARATRMPFAARLLSLLRRIEDDWSAMIDRAPHVGASGDPHQTLLDVVGLHPASVEHHWRYSESLDELYNVLNLGGLGPRFWEALTALGLQAQGAGLLERLGYEGPAPDILDHVFLGQAGLIENVVDDRPLSESDPIREYTDDHRNYIRWLIDAATTSLDDLVAEEGFTGDVSPQALLYLLLRHALLLGYYDTSYELHKSAEFASARELQAMKPEPRYIHVDDTAAHTESRYAALYKSEPRITGSQSLLVGEFITQNLRELLQSRGLVEQVDALRVLANAPTAQLERDLVDHLDVCSYRFDAWLLGIVAWRLDRMRQAQPRGLYLGAYGWLEDLRPSHARLDPVRLPSELQSTFAGGAPLRHDASNGGYVLAPSLPHARTAAVLRSGYLANATPEHPDTLAVNLASDRVRLALSILEGIRNGQSLGALLGYRFERGLHDDHDIAEVDKFIYPLRKAFPLVADSLSSTQTPPGVPIEAVEARNVLDGRKLLDQIASTGQAGYPFGKSGLPKATATEKLVIDRHADAVRDVSDAVADLALAEGVHQAVQGNFDRVAATLDAYSSGNFPPEPEVVQTPATGIGLTQRVAVHLRPGLAAPAGATPRASAEPAVDRWLADLLPALDGVGCTVEWEDPVTGKPRSHPVTLHDLGLRPLDLLALVKPDDVQAMAELDDRVLRVVHAAAHPRPDARLEIGYQTPPAGKLSVFEVSGLLRSLRTIVQRSRPLRATDATLQLQARPTDDAEVFVDRARVGDPKQSLDTLRGDVDAFLSPLNALLADTDANRKALVDGVDGFLDSAVALLERAARFGIPQSGWGFAYEWRRAALADLLAEAEKLVDRWDGRLADFQARLSEYDLLPPATPDDARFVALQAAEALVAAVLDPLPATPALMRAGLDAKGQALADKRDDFASLLAANHPSFTAAVQATAGLLPTAAFDPEPFDLKPFEDRAVNAAKDAATSVGGLLTAIDARRQAAQAQLDVHDAAASPAARAEALQAAAAALLGDEFTLVPEFTVSPDRGAEWANALAASSSGNLLEHLVDTLKVERPVDAWLYGLARVRPMLAAWESTSVLLEALERPVPDLVPIQLPHVADARWVAMEFPDDHRPDSDRLLYTAHYSTAFDPAGRQCGLLIDEWTEVIPGTSKDTGVTFHFDRPDSEPPQSILMVLPATGDGEWHWEDVVGALHETLDLAKKRALEPANVDATAYARFLPATIMAVTLRGLTISTALAATKGVFGAKEVIERA